ncbi:HAD family hydrolase [Cohnella yongneupensis]|uniref:HAD family hydrolase n=1 Tax=Cohnella yongneupensis TaxID=425006 RepID=A0ABW0QUZ7_9BACL
MSEIKAVILDLDNTVLDRTSTFRAFAASFVDHYFAHAEHRVKLIEDIVARDLDGYKDKPALFRELLSDYEWTAKPDHEALMNYYRVHYVKHATLMDQAKNVLSYLRSKYRTALITNGMTTIQYGKIDQAGIRDDFDLIIVSEEAGVKKPDPAIFGMATKKFGLTPAQCVYVGDHPVNDIGGAANAGMQTIWLQWTQPWREEVKAKPLHTITRLAQLTNLL